MTQWTLEVYYKMLFRIVSFFLGATGMANSATLPLVFDANQGHARSEVR